MFPCLTATSQTPEREREREKAGKGGRKREEGGRERARAREREREREREKKRARAHERERARARARKRDLGNHGGTNNKAALNELVGLVAQDLAVLARAGLGLVRVDHQIARTAVRLVLGHERVLETRREP
jgi:hypothetical protein